MHLENYGRHLCRDLIIVNASDLLVKFGSTHVVKPGTPLSRFAAARVDQALKIDMGLFKYNLTPF